MAEATQPVQQGEGLATTASSVSSYPRPRGRRRIVWLIVLLLLGGIAGTAAWQRLDIQGVWQRLSMQPIEEQAVSAPASQAANVAILHDSESTPCILKAFIDRMLWGFPNSSSGRKTFRK
jgi:hypothetical protein